MKPIAEEDRDYPDKTSPLKQHAETVEEQNLKNTLELLVASGKITEDDVLHAWRLGWVA